MCIYHNSCVCVCVTTSTQLVMYFILRIFACFLDLEILSFGQTFMYILAKHFHMYVVVLYALKFWPFGISARFDFYI